MKYARSSGYVHVVGYARAHPRKMNIVLLYVMYSNRKMSSVFREGKPQDNYFTEINQMATKMYEEK